MGFFEQIGAAFRQAILQFVPQVPIANSSSFQEIAPNPYTDRMPEIFGASLTPQMLTSIIFERNEGNLTRWIDLADEAREKDLHLHSQLSLLEERVANTEFSVTPGSGSNRRAAERAASACRELMEHWASRMGPTGEQSCLHDWLAEWSGTRYYGRGAHELMWVKDGSELILEGAEKISTRRLSYRCAHNDPRPWSLRLQDEYAANTPYSKIYGIPIEDLPREKILVVTARVRGAQRVREGIFSTVVWYWLFKIWAFRDVMALAEMIGRPPTIGYYNAGGAKADEGTAKMNGDRTATEKDVAALRKAVQSVSGSLRAVLPDTTRVDALDLRYSANEPMQLQIARIVDEYISKAIHGVANVSDLKAGARAAVEVQERVADIPWIGGVRIATRALSRMFALYIRSNPQRFGDNCPLPIVTGNTQGTIDRKAVGEGINEAKKAGVKVPRAWAHKELRIPEPLTVRGETEPVLDSAPEPNPNNPPNEPAQKNQA